MANRLALDIGTTSIGWSLFALDPAGIPCAIRAMGVRVFADGRTPKSNADRRRLRAIRRRRDRYLQRRRAMLNALTRHGLMPAEEAARAEVATRDPYALRARALSERLAPYDLGRVIFHLNQRRGLGGNRRTVRDDEERGRIRDAAARLRAELALSGHVTLGSWFAARHAAREPVRARLQGVGIRSAYPFYPTRDLIEAEFDAIWAAQSAWNPALTPAVGAALRRILTFQRPLREPPAGRCWLEPTEPRAPRALPSSQAFRIAQDLAHLAILRVGDVDRTPTPTQRTSLSAQLNAGRDLPFFRLRWQLRLMRDEMFKRESHVREGIGAAETAKRLAAPKKPLHRIWPTLDGETRDAVVTVLLETQSRQDTVAKLIALGIPAPAAEEAESITLPDGHAALSTRAIGKILPHLESGMLYGDAVRAAGYADPSDDRGGVILPALPYYGEVLGGRLGTGTGETGDPPERRYGRVPDPTVHLALNQVRHVVNALIAQFGHPQEIVVKVLRGAAHSARQSGAIEHGRREGRSRRDQWTKQLARLGLPPNGRNMALMRLWHEQAPNPGQRACPYTGEPIPIERLFSGQIEVDHILPFSVTLDDSFNNRVLVTPEGKRRKARQTPFDAFHAAPDWPEILTRVKLLPPAKAWRFGPDALGKWQGGHGDALAPHLTDGSYVARLARWYLRTICDDRKLRVVPGRLTALLRHNFGLDSATLLGGSGARRERTDHRHHAIDALTVGLLDRALLQRAAAAARRGEQDGRLMAKLEEPWPGFMAETARALGRMVVSYKRKTAVSRRLHSDTTYGTVAGAGDAGPNVAHHVPVQALAAWSAAEVAGAIADPPLRRRIGAALATAGKAEQAAALARIEHAPGVFVRRVQVRERLEGIVEIRDRRSGRAYRRVRQDKNHFAEFWRLPRKGDKPGKVKVILVSVFLAAAEAEARRLGRPAPDWRPHPAARRLLRLYRNDIIAVGVGAERRLLRVVIFSPGQVMLAPTHEAGNLKARSLDSGDPFNFVFASFGLLRGGQARKVAVDPLGRVRDPGPVVW